MNRLLLPLTVAISVFLIIPPVSSEESTAKVQDATTFESWGNLVVGGVWNATLEGVEWEDTYEWLLDKKFLKLTERENGSPDAAATAVIGIDPRNGKMTRWEFHKDGTVGQGTWTLVRDGVWSVKAQFDGPKGKQASTGVVTKLSQDGGRVESEMVTNGVSEGKRTSLWTRRAASSERFQEYGQAMVGQWEAEIVLAGDVPGVGKNGEKVKSRGSIAWACDKKGLEWEWQLGPVSGRGMSLWDPESKQIKETSFESNGGVYRGHVVKEGVKWIAIGTTVYLDGTRRSVTDTLTIADGGETHIHEGTVLLNGKKQPGYRDVWKRVGK